MCMWTFIVQVYCIIITNNGTEPSLEVYMYYELLDAGVWI